MMTSIAKGLMIAGAALILGGLFFYVFSKIPGIGRLPGDILIKRESFTLYVPITTCFLISFILSILFFVWNQK